MKTSNSFVGFGDSTVLRSALLCKPVNVCCHLVVELGQMNTCYTVVYILQITYNIIN